MASFQINQPSSGPGEPDASRFDLVAGELITLTAVDPSPGAGITYQWEIVDRAGTASSLSGTTGPSVTIGAQADAPFAFLVEMRVYTNELLTATARRALGARSPKRGLRLPLFSETADPGARLASPNVQASTDNAVYSNRAGTGLDESNWRGWTEFLHELVMAVEDSGEDEGTVVGDVLGPGSATTGSVAVFGDGTHIVEAGIGVSAGNLLLGSGKTVDGRDVSVDGTKLDGIEAGAQAVSLARVNAATGRNAATDGTKLDGVEAGAQVTSLARINTATGRIAATDGAKLDGIEAGAQVTSAARVATALAASTAALSVNSQKITNLADPANPQDAATRAYVLANAGAGGSGNVVGPASATDNAIVRFDTATGKLVQSSTPLVQDDGRISNLTDPTAPQDAATRAYVLANAGTGGGGGGGDTIVGRAIPDLATVVNAPLGHWVFGTNGTVDLSGNARTLTVGAPVPPGASIDFVNATGYFGGGGYYSSAHASFRLLTNLTIEAVINMNAAGGVIAMCGAAGESESTNHHYDFEVVSGGFLYFLCESGAGINATAQSTGVVPLNEWVHVAVTRATDGRSIEFFINGFSAGTAMLASAASAVGGSTASLGVMRDITGGGTSLSGSAALLAIYGTTLTAAQVSALAKRRLGVGDDAVDFAVKWRDVLDLVLGDQTPVAIPVGTAQQEIQIGPIKAYSHDWVGGKLANAGLSASGLRLNPVTAYHTWPAANPANTGNLSPPAGVFIPLSQLADYDPELPVSVEILFSGTGIRGANCVEVAIVYATSVAVGGAGTTTLDRVASAVHSFSYSTANGRWGGSIWQGGSGGTVAGDPTGGVLGTEGREQAIGIVRTAGGRFAAISRRAADEGLPESFESRLEASTASAYVRSTASGVIASGCWGISIAVEHNTYNAPVEPVAADVYIKRLRVRQRGIYLASAPVATAPASDWQTYCDFNFTQMPSQTIAQGINVIDGVQMRADFVANAVTFAIVNGTGLYVKNTAANTNFYHSARNAPMLFVDLPVDVPGWLLDMSEVRISAEWQTTVATANYSASGLGVAKQPFVVSADLSVHFWHQYTTGAMRRAIARLCNATEQSPTISNTYNTGMIHFRSQFQHEWYAKSNAAADTVANATVLDSTTMTRVGSVLESNGYPNINVAPYIANQDHLIAFWTGHSDNTLGNAEHVCKRLRIEYRLAASSSAVARAISGDWETALDLNLTQDAAFTFVDGTQTWHGIPTVGKNIASGSLQAAIVPGTGLVIQANTTNTDISGSNDTGPQVQIPLDALIPRFVVGSSRVRVHIQWRVIADADIELALFGIRRPWKDTTSAHMFCMGRGYNSYSGGTNYYVASQNIGTTSTGSGNLTKTDNLGCIETDGFITRYFSSRSTAPLSDANSAVLDMTKQACVFKSDGSAGTVGKASELSVFFGALTLNTGRDVQLVVERLRIEYKL